MRTIKLDVNSLEKGKETRDTDSTSKKMREHKKKMLIERTLLGYNQDLAPHTRDNSPTRTAPGPKNSLHQDQILRDQDPPSDDPQKASKSSIKLPTINPRGAIKQLTENGFETANDSETREESEATADFNVRSTGGTSVTVQRQKNSMKESEEKKEDGLSSFLKYVQLKPMRREEKSPHNDFSMRDLKPTRVEKTLVMKANKEAEETQPPQTKLQKRSSQKFTRLRKTEEKSEKTISSYSIRKEKRVLSISQPTRPRKEKLTNSYWDFCRFVCLLNKTQRPSTPSATYKAFVGKGNNSILIKNSLKSRFWWNILDSQVDVNLHWTQCKDGKFIQTLKSFEPEPEAEMPSEEALIKKIDFLISKENSEKTVNESIRQFTGSGLNKLLSNQEKKKMSKNNWQAEVPIEPQYRKLGNPNKLRAHNHFQFHWHISNKKALYYNLKKLYEATKEDPFIYIPLTFHVQKHGDEEWMNFLEAFKERGEELKGKESKIKKKKEKNLWIVKPGENSNQGNGIQVFDNLEEIADLVKSSCERVGGRNRSYIVQRYLMPFLYNKRKFDIRCYVLVTSVNNIMKAYWYEEGYIRTSSKEFTLKNLKNRFIHLTNDAVQKKCEDYGKFENGNKVSYSDFQKYLDNTQPERDLKFYSSVYPAMIKRAADVIKSACMVIDSNKREFTFEIFGLDYMIDEEFNTWLIEVNTNPCLELGCPLLARIIPNMVENALKIAVDPLFPPPKDYPKTKTVPGELFEGNKFSLIFNSSEEQEVLRSLTKDTNLSHIIESDDEDENHDDIE